MSPVVVSFELGLAELNWACAALRQTYLDDASSQTQYIRAFEHSVCVAAFINDQQVGFGRAVTDRAIVAYLSDIIVAPEWRRRGVGTAIISSLLNHSQLSTVHAWSLRTADAHGLYERFGFKTADDGHYMRMLR